MNFSKIFIGLIIYCFSSFGFETFEPISKPDIKKRLDYVKEIIKDQPNLEQYAKIRYGDYGTTAFSRLKNLCDQYEVLIAYPALVIKLEEFEKFVNENKLECGDPWQAAQSFSDSLGTVTVYRAINLNPAEFENVRKNGIQSDALRQNKNLKAYNNISIIFELMRRAQKEKVRLQPNLADKTISITPDAHVARTVSKSLAERKDMGNKDMYLFKIEIPKLESLFISPTNARMCEYSARNNEKFAPFFTQSQEIVRPLLCKSSFFPEDVETFVEFLIEPSEVKEYEKEALTQDSVRQAQQDVEKIILKQACEEIEKIKTVVHAGFYHEVKSPCSIKPMQAYPQTHQYPSYQYQQNQYYMQYPQYQQYQQYPQYPQYQQYQQYPQYPQYQQYQQYQQYPQYPAPQQSQRQQYQ